LASTSHVQGEKADRKIPQDAIALVLGIVHIMEEKDFSMLLETDEKGRSSFLMSLFGLLRLVLEQSVFNSNWVAMRLHEIYASFKILSWISKLGEYALENSVLADYFSLCLLYFRRQHIRDSSERAKRTALVKEQMQLFASKL
jgi:hypothetical protein